MKQLNGRRNLTSSTSRWINGPKFQKLHENEWPIKNINTFQTEEELKEDNLIIQHIDPIINTKRFSRWCRICDRLKNRKQPLTNNELTQDELLKAESLLLKEAQHEMFF